MSRLKDRLKGREKPVVKPGDKQGELERFHATEEQPVGGRTLRGVPTISDDQTGVLSERKARELQRLSAPPPKEETTIQDEIPAHGTDPAPGTPIQAQEPTIPVSQVEQIVRNALKEAIASEIGKIRTSFQNSINDLKSQIESRFQKIELEIREIANTQNVAPIQKLVQDLMSKFDLLVRDTVGRGELDVIIEELSIVRTRFNELVGEDGERINGMAIIYEEELKKHLVLLVHETDDHKEIESILESFQTEMGSDAVWKCIDELIGAEAGLLEINDKLSQFIHGVSFDRLKSEKRFETYVSKIEEQGQRVFDSLSKIAKEAQEVE